MSEEAKQEAARRINITSHDDKATDEPTKPVITHRPMLKDPATAPVVDSSALPDEPPPSANEIKKPTVNKSVVKPLDSPEETVPISKPTTKTDEAKASPADKPTETTAKAETPAPNNTVPEPTKKDENTKRSDDDAEDEETTKAVSTEEELNAAAEAQAKHDEAIQKLVDAKQYFLPINAVEKRKTKRFIVLGAVFSVLLLLAWADIALDAGLIQISGVKPVTHFFSN